jgi:hypothetical protein
MANIGLPTEWILDKLSGSTPKSAKLFHDAVTGTINLSIHGS